ncbi:MAG: DUF523 domain-containing protein [Pseudomonadota bacterium]
MADDSLLGMERILISACLIGQPVRYDGAAKTGADPALLARWRAEGRLVPVCPEVAVGFPTPRPPAEIAGRGEEADGRDVLDGLARVVEATGTDVTAQYLRAAQETVALATARGCRHAVLTDGSPSCGSGFIYDGSFSGATRPGMGVVTAALRAAGVRVWAQGEMAQLEAALAEG